MKTTQILRVACCIAAPLVLVGCRSGYEVDVRNMTDQPLELRLNTPHPDGAPHPRAIGRAGPGDRTKLYLQTNGGERVWLQADFEGNVGYPATVDLTPGLTVVNARRIDEGSKGRIRLEEIPRP